MIAVEQFAGEVRQFCERHLAPRSEDSEHGWGVGPDAIVVIEEPDPVEEREKLSTAIAWRRLLDEHRLAWLRGPEHLGGRGLGADHEDVFRSVIAAYEAPDESPLSIGLEIVGPAVAVHGSDGAKAELLRGIHVGEHVACQLFSEPEAGSDLSSIHTRATRVQGGWRLSGQKVWTSGAHLATTGEVLARTDPDSQRHAGLTMMMVDMTQPGVDIRPLRQMTGGASFNEVFLDEAFVPDEHVLGSEGSGWQVALTTLMQERLSVGAGRTSPANLALGRLRQLIRHLGLGDDPIVRQRLAGLVARDRVAHWFVRRMNEGGREPGPEMSIAKLHFTSLLCDIGDLASHVLGARLAADTDEWGTFAWTEFVNGAPGMRIAGGTDQIQRNLLGERVLGLPR